MKRYDEMVHERLATSDNDNFGPWTDWAGGECPIPDAKPFEWEYRIGGEMVLCGAGDPRSRDYKVMWQSNITAYRVRLPADDLLRQAIEALRGLVADDITYDGRIVKIECVNHTDAIAKVISARAVLAAYDKREQS